MAHLQRLVQIAHNSSIHLEHVIDDALDMSRLENNQFEIFKASFDFIEAIEEVHDLMKFQTNEKGLEFILEIHESVPQVIYSDKKRIKQVLFNLIGNAIKFTLSGRVSLQIKYETLTNVLTAIVRDTGEGILPEDLSKLFKFFGKLSSTKAINQGGMGLGLTISKMIVQQLGGEIDVESRNKVGSKFFFTLPLEQDLPLLDINDEAVGAEIQRSHDFELLPDSDTESEIDPLSFEESKGNSGILAKQILNQERRYRRGQSIDKQYIRLQSPSRAINTIESLNNRLGRRQRQPKVRIHLLTIDDTPSNLFVMEMLLGEIKDIDITFKTALSGNIALQIVQNAQVSFTHIFVDIHMPVMDGYTVANRLQELKSQGLQCLQGAIIIACSATSQTLFQSKNGASNFDLFCKLQSPSPLYECVVVEKPLELHRLKNLLVLQ